LRTKVFVFVEAIDQLGQHRYEQHLITGGPASVDVPHKSPGSRVPAFSYRPRSRPRPRTRSLTVAVKGSLHWKPVSEGTPRDCICPPEGLEDEDEDEDD